MIEEFEGTSDISVDATSGSSETVLQKVVIESSVSLGVDVLENPCTEKVIVNHQGLFQDYESEYRDAVVEGATVEGWTANCFRVFVAGWKTDNVYAATIPLEL